jgi:hypothetical protein
MSTKVRVTTLSVTAAIIAVMAIASLPLTKDAFTAKSAEQKSHQASVSFVSPPLLDLSSLAVEQVAHVKEGEIIILANMGDDVQKAVCPDATKPSRLFRLQGQSGQKGFVIVCDR